MSWMLATVGETWRKSGETWPWLVTACQVVPVEPLRTPDTFFCQATLLHWSSCAPTPPRLQPLLVFGPRCSVGRSSQSLAIVSREFPTEIHLRPVFHTARLHPGSDPPSTSGATEPPDPETKRPDLRSTGAKSPLLRAKIAANAPGHNESNFPRVYPPSSCGLVLSTSPSILHPV